MTNDKNISVSFTPAQAAFLDACVESGRYQSASDVLRDALRLLERQHQLRLAELDRARALIREGAEQVDRGETVDAESFFQGWDEELNALEARGRSAAG